MGLLSRNENTILGVNFLNEDKILKKKKLETSMTSSMKIFFSTKIKYYTIIIITRYKYYYNNLKYGCNKSDKR